MEPFGITPEDFKKLPKDGARFEALVCQLLAAMGFRILEEPAVGTEGGRDVLVERSLKDVMGERREKVVVQCKHHAHSGRAVSDNDVGVWQNAMTRYNSRGYLLVTDTRPTENLSKSFREFSSAESNYTNWAAFWDVDQLITYLNEHPHIRDSFFPRKVAQTPLEELAEEVRSWLSAIRYSVSDPQPKNDRTVDLVATLNQGTIEQQVLVRLIGGEIRPRDVETLSNDLDIKTPQGWLISDRRVSKQARNSAAKTDNIGVFNLADLLQQKIWGTYFESLASLIKQDDILSRYVDIGCYKIETDAQGNVIERETLGHLDDYIDEWLKERGKMHISLLGDFGAGKTWFCRHYAYRQLERFLKNPAKERLPLLLTLRTFTKAMTAQQLVNDALIEQYKLPFIGSAFDIFQEMNQRGKLLLILDGFDEMARKVDYQTVVDNFWELAKLVEEGGKVILTSRTEYFRWVKESEKVLGGEEFGRQTLVLEPPKFEVIYLEQFNNDQIRQVIIKSVGATKGPALADTVLKSRNLAEMARKPLLIDLLLAALDEASVDLLENQARVFLFATQSLLLRNITANKTFTSTSDKLYFLCELAWEMLRDNELRLHYKSFPGRIRRYFGQKVDEQHELDTWDYDLRSQTLLHRDAAGYYEFAHKSLAEYFVAFKFAAELGCLDVTFKQTYREADGQPCQIPVSQKDIADLSESFGVFSIARTSNSTVSKFLSQMLSETAHEKLLGIMRETQDKSPDQVKYAGGNAVTLLNMRGFSFAQMDLSKMVLTGAELWHGELPATNLTGTIFDRSFFRFANLRKAQCKETSFRNCYLLSPFLNDCNFEEADFSEATLTFGLTILAVSYSPEGKRLATTVGKQKRPAIWDIETNKEGVPLRSSNSSLQTVRFSPLGDSLASGGTQGYLTLHNATNGEIIWERQAHKDYVRWLSFSPDGKLLASVGDDSLLIISDARSGEKLSEFKASNPVYCVSFSPDGRFLAAGTEGGVVIIWEAASSTVISQEKTFDTNVHFVSFCADSKSLISGGLKRSDATSQVGKQKSRTDKEVFTVIKHDALHGNSNQIMSTPYSGGWYRGDVSQHASYVAIRVEDDACLIWDYETDRRVSLLSGHTNTLFCAAFSPDGKHIATCSGDGTIRIWDLHTGELKRCIFTVKFCQGARFERIKGLGTTDYQLLRSYGAEVIE